MTAPTLTPAAAAALQKELAGRLVLRGEPAVLNFVAGADVAAYPAFRRSRKVEGPGDLLVGAVVVWSLSRRETAAAATAVREADFPYIPGLLAFRELPVLLEAFRNLPAPYTPPALTAGKTDRPLKGRRLESRECAIHAVLCDGQGIAHPRRMGIACHLGLELNLPTVGCGKTRLTGVYREPPPDRGARSVLFAEARPASPQAKAEEIGRVLRTRAGVRPVFVSPGHLIGMDAAADLVLRCSTRFRLPEPLRAAHRLAGETLRHLR